MSLNMFPSAGQPSFTEGMDDRTLPRGPAEGHGPYGAYNTDAKPDPGDLEIPPDRDLELDDMDHPPKYAKVTDALFSDEQTQEVLDDALERAKILMNPIITRAIKASPATRPPSGERSRRGTAASSPVALTMAQRGSGILTPTR